MSNPPSHDIAHLANIELLTPELDKSRWFFTDVLGLTEVSSEGDSVYPRAGRVSGARPG